MAEPPRTHADCARFLAEFMAEKGVEITVSTQPPLVLGPYTEDAFECPHGSLFYLEPTGEQIAQWVKDGVR